jgi:amino-acid N-acetyltransferase
MQATESDPADASFESGVRAVVAPVISSRPDLTTVHSLLASAGLPTGDLTEGHLEHFFYAGSASRPLGVVGVEMLGDVGLLRSLVVRDESRGSGLGSVLVERVEAHARSQGVRAIYLLTTSAQPFFAARGYRTAARDQAPEAIRSTREFAALCPASAAFMTKQL